MSGIITNKLVIEAEVRKLMGYSEYDHFWLRVEVQCDFLKVGCMYTENSFQRLTSSSFFQNWWIVQCLHAEQNYIKAYKAGQLGPDVIENYYQQMKVRLSRRDVMANQEMVVDRILQQSTKQKS